nr:TetR/AcrR family transcriptional regulator [Streptomyces sp. A012304]
METFATEGLSVPVAEIARRAGAGTVSRHFPTKESLYEAIVLHLVGGIVDKARDLSAQNDPGSAFFQFLAHMVEQATVNRGLAEAISGAGFDVEAVAFRPEHSLGAVEGELLTRAQQGCGTAGHHSRRCESAPGRLSGPRTSGLRPGSPAAHDRRGVHRPASRTGHTSRRPGACRLSGSFSDF